LANLILTNSWDSSLSKYFLRVLHVLRGEKFHG
jgi:hypothetical protein